MANPDTAANSDDDTDGAERSAPAETGGDELPKDGAATEPPPAAEATPDEPAANPVGAAADPVPPFGTVPPVPAPKSALRSFGVLISFGVALALVLTVTLVFTLVSSDLSKAENRVLSYFDSLSSKDGESAGELLKDVQDDLYDSNTQLYDRITDSPFWENPTLAHGYSPPTEVEVVSSEAGVPPGVRTKPGREYAFVTVGYTVADSPASESFGLERKPEGDWTIITASVGNFYVSEGSLWLEILDESTGDFEIDESVAAPPGAYKVSLDDNEIFENSKSRIAVAPGLNGSYGSSSPISTLDVKAREGVLDEVKSQVDSLIDTCATGEDWDYDTPTCPWSGVDPDETPEEVDGVWKVNAYPKIEIAVGYFGQAVVETVEAGSATNEEIDVTADLEPEGRVTVENGDVVWHSNQEL